MANFYSEKTEEILLIPKEVRKKIGLFPTEKDKVDFTLSKLSIEKKDFVLEPSFGTGEFLIPLKNLSDNVFGVEKEKEIFNDFGNCFNDDFLTWDTNLKFDFIIGNPPFFETKDYKEQFSEISYGRNNIYSFFIKKSIELLKDNGILAFIIPRTLNTGMYFYKVRDFIINNTDIEGIYDLDNFSGVNQHLQLIILKKCKNTGRYLVKKDNITIFSQEYEKLNSLITNCKSIHDLGFAVKTGSFIWNENKELLSNDEKDTLLVWGGNISDFRFVPAEERVQFVKKEHEFSKAIVSNRIFGGKLNFCLIDKPFLAENHVNVIINEKELISYEDLIELLKNSKINEYCKFFTGSTQISKKELEEMPIWGAIKENGQIK